MRKVFTAELPIRRITEKNPEGSIDWEKSFKREILYEYDDTKGSLQIVSFDKKTRMLGVEYLDRKPFMIAVGHFIEGRIGRLIGVTTNEFVFNIGETFIDRKRNFTIIGTFRKKNKKGSSQKWYKYKCSKCGYEGDIEEHQLKSGIGCSVCVNQRCVYGINSIMDKNPWMEDYFVDKELCKKYTSGSNIKIEAICPVCGKAGKKLITISSIYKRHSMGCTWCSDGVSYPEKFFASVLTQLKLDYIPQLSQGDFKWCLKYKYDFYINSIKAITETHGAQHYIYDSAFGKTLQEELDNDENKKQLALHNGIEEKNYIVINCRFSQMEWIRDHVLSSELANYYDLSKIDWLKCEEHAVCNLIRVACKYKKDNTSLTCNDIALLMNMGRQAIRKYLKKGDLLGWCEYNIEKEILEGKKRTRSNNVRDREKPIEIFKDGESLGVFSSCAELTRQSLEKFGIQFQASLISKVCIGERHHHHNFTFCYIEDKNNIKPQLCLPLPKILPIPITPIISDELAITSISTLAS